MKHIASPVTLMIGLAFSPATGQVTITLHPEQDAVIGFHDNYNSANTNYGSADYFGAFSQPGASGGENAAHSLMEFDLSAIPGGSTINSATRIHIINLNTNHHETNSVCPAYL